MSSGFKNLGRFYILALFFLVSMPPDLGAFTDQILAVVNDHLITESDVRVQTLFSLEFPLLEESGVDSHLQFAIDQILILEDAEKFATDKPTEQEIDDFIKKIESNAGSSEKLTLQLANEGLTRNDLKILVSRFLLSKKFIDQRINYFIFIPENEIESYFNEHQAEWNGSSIDAVRSKINSILFEQKRKSKLEEYISKRRSKALIKFTPPYTKALP